MVRHQRMTCPSHLMASKFVILGLYSTCRSLRCKGTEDNILTAQVQTSLGVLFGNLTWWSLLSSPQPPASSSSVGPSDEQRCLPTGSHALWRVTLVGFRCLGKARGYKLHIRSAMEHNAVDSKCFPSLVG